MNKTLRKLLVTVLVAGMSVMLLSGFAGVATGNSRGFKTMAGLRTAVAQVLGLETDAIFQAQQDGKTLRELLVEKNIDVEAFVQEQVAVREAVVDQLVAEGRMTAEQAATCLANLEQNLDKKLDSTNACGLGQGGMGGGQGRGMGNMMRGGFGWGK
ncbi:MAG: hypothetical protein FD169_1052 [Bacillota bacterium]|nr:MAG: hypothetical protein FD169_1052 [Bacillota bacterium]